jgi:beta-lactamase regulating signal transducer with metallopeptidase domain
MNSALQLWIESQLWPWLGDIAWQSTAILGITLLVVRLLRHRSAIARHSLLALGIVSIAWLLLLSFFMPTWSVRPGATPTPNPHAAPLVVSEVPHQPVAELPPKPTPHRQFETSSALPSPPVTLSLPAAASPGIRLTFPAIIAVIWLSGIFLGAMLLAVSMLRLRRLRLRAENARQPHLLTALRRACEDAGIHTTSVQLLLTDRGIMPAMWGWRRITVLLPRDAEGWTRERLDFVLRHELAHAARADAALSLACWLAMLPFWWHPLAWLSLRTLSRLREEACDEHVVSGLSHSQHMDYAETLMQVIASASPLTRRAWLPALAMASAQARTLRKRLEAIVDEHRDRRPFTRRGRACACVFIVLLATGFSMLSGCRESSKPATGTTNVDGSRTYFLTDRQWTTLTKLSREDRPAPEVQPVDPFAPAGSTRVATIRKVESPESLAKHALRIRTCLVAEGVEFATSSQAEVVVLQDERTMRVWADDANHEKITKVLHKAGQKTMVRIVCHAFAVPFDSAWINELTKMTPASEGTFRQLAPSLNAVLSEAEAATLIDKMRADKACTLFATPTVTTTDRHRATIEVIRELIYATEFDPPHVPDNVAGKPGDSSTPATVPITPTTPTAFEMRPVGLRCEIDPEVEPGGMISLSLAPEWTVFEGFINYGQPIYASTTDAAGKVTAVELSPNKIQQPLFRNNSVRTTVTLKSGDHIVLGGFGEPPGADLANPQGRPGSPFKLSIAGKGEVQVERSAGTQAATDGNMEIKNLPPMSKVDRAIFFLFQAKLVE